MPIQINGTTVIDDSRNITNVGNVDGRDVSADGTKLDGIEANAKDDQTITAGAGLTGGGTGDVTLNIGAGTGITVNANDVAHADTSTQVSVNNTGRTYIQDITLDTFGHVTGLTSATETVVNTDTTYTAGGDYGMTLSGTEFRLEDDRRRNSTTADIYSGNTNDYTFYDADVGIRWYTAGAEDMRLTDDGDLHVDGNIIAYSTTISDIRLKHDIKKIDNALEKVQQLNGYTFTYNKENRMSAGVIAQEVEKVLPSAIVDDELPFQGEVGVLYKTVQYDQLHGLLIEAIKEQQKQIDELKAKLGDK